MNRSIFSTVKTVSALAPQAISATTNGANVNTQGYDSALIVVNCGGLVSSSATADKYWSLSLQHADDDGAGAPSTWSNVTNLQVLKAEDITVASGIWQVINATAEATAVYKAAYLGNKQWIRVVATKTSTPGNLNIGAECVLSHGHFQPDVSHDQIDPS